MQLAPSKNPEKESKQFSVLGLTCGAASLFLWFVGIAGFAFSLRGLILSRRVHNTQQTVVSIAGIVLSVIAIAYGLSK